MATNKKGPKEPPALKNNSESMMIVLQNRVTQLEENEQRLNEAMLKLISKIETMSKAIGVYG